MQSLSLLLIPLLEYAIPVRVPQAIALRHYRKPVTTDQVLSCVLAGGFWLGMITVLPGKTLANAIVEPLVLAALGLLW